MRFLYRIGYTVYRREKPGPHRSCPQRIHILFSLFARTSRTYGPTRFGLPEPR